MMLIHQDMTLSTGAVVKHKPMENGATDAYLSDGRAMTEAEWQEYCHKLHARNQAARTAASYSNLIRFAIDKGMAFQAATFAKQAAHVALTIFENAG